MTDLPAADLIYTRLFWDADKAVTIGELAESLSLSRRTVEQAVETLRARGAPVITGSRGVWLSTSSAELFDSYRRLRRRALTQLRNLRGLQRTARSMQAVEERMKQETIWGEVA